MPPCSAPPVVRVPPVNLESTSLSNEVKPLQPTCHILLCSYRAEDGQDVLDAWHSLEWQRFTHCEITHLTFSDDRDLLGIMILLDQVRHGFFTAVFISPPAATWSRLRNSQVLGQVPLRSRQCPLGMMSLSPESQSKVRASNFSLEVSSWFAEQILTSPQLQTFFLLVFPEDFGGDSCTGPASPWSAREFTDLSDAVEAQRGAVYLCRFASAECRRSVGLLTNVQALSADMYLGWPAFNTQDSTLQYCGPLPSTCACSTMHPSLRGLATQGGFRSFLAQSLGPQFWARILSRMQESQLHCSLRDGVQSSTAGIISHGGFPGYGFALADSPDSVAALYREWKANTLTRSLLRDFSASRLDTFFESRGLARDAVLLFSLLSPACKFLDSGRAAARWLWVFPWCLLVLLLPLFLFVLPVFAVTITFLVFLPISVTLRIIAVLRVLQGFSQCCLAVQPSTGRRVLSTPRHLEMGRYGSILLSLTSPSDSRTRLICRGFHEVQHLWTLSTLRHLDFRARRRRGSFHGSLMSELGGDARSWTLLASWLRYVVLGSRVPPHRHVRVCNHLRSVVGREDRMAMAVPRCLQLALLRATSAHKTGNCAGCVLTF